MEVSGELHAPGALPLVRTEYKAAWTPELVWTLWKEKSLALAGNPAHALSLYRLSYPSSPHFKVCSTVPGRSVRVHAYSEAVLLFSHVDLKTTKYLYSLNTLIILSVNVEWGISHSQPSNVTVIKSWIWVSHVLGVTKLRNACRMSFGGGASSWIHLIFRGRARIIFKWTTEKKSVKCELNISGSACSIVRYGVKLCLKHLCGCATR
jgi:hypothetical protein